MFLWSNMENDPQIIPVTPSHPFLLKEEFALRGVDSFNKYAEFSGDTLGTIRTEYNQLLDSYGKYQ